MANQEKSCEFCEHCLYICEGDFKFHVDTGGAIVCSNDAYELLDALRDMHWL